MNRSRIDVELLLRHLGIPAKKTHGGKWVATCPEPSHRDSDPSWSIVDRPGDGLHASHYCFSCKFGGGPWELAAAIWGETPEEAGPKIDAVLLNGARPAEAPTVIVPTLAAPKKFKLPIGVEIPETIADWYEPALAYLRSRGVTDDQILRYGIGYAIRGKLRLRVVIPVFTAGELKTFSARAFAAGVRRYDAGKEVDGARPSEAIFGEPFFEGRETITVSEGCFSALALERAGAINPCAILSSELTPGRILQIKRFKRVVVCTDPDKAGDHAAAVILNALGRRRYIERVRFPESPDDMDPEDLRDFFA